MKKILCLSGGGVRGVAQLQVLKKLEKDAGRPLCEEYDLIIGTSVGAINAAIIATGKISMEDLDTKYDDMIDNVFKKRGFFKKPKYDRQNFVKSWESILGKGMTVGDAKTRLMVTTVDLVSDINIFYKSWHEDDAKESMTDIVCRSFAAPLYFGQMVDKDEQRVYTDGGVGNANLPLNEAKLQAEAYGWYSDGEEVEIHAIGTLFSMPDATFKEVAKGRWTRQVLDFMNPAEGGLARAQSGMDQIRRMRYICGHIPTIKFKYWDSAFDKKKLKLDGVKYMDQYRKQGELMALMPLIQI